MSAAQKIPDAHGDVIFVERVDTFSASYGAVVQVRLPSEHDGVDDLRWTGNAEQLGRLIEALKTFMPQEPSDDGHT